MREQDKPLPDERASFEAWFSENGLWPKGIERNHQGHYKLLTANSAWNVWQARAAIAADRAARVPVPVPAERIDELVLPEPTEMPTYGRIPWQVLCDAVSEANIGKPGLWKPQGDENTYIGHKPVSMNMNSLNRIVSKFAADRAARPVLTDEQIDALFQRWNLGGSNEEAYLFYANPESKKIEMAFRDGVRAGFAATQGRKHG